MKNELIVKKSIKVNADISAVWDALTNPEMTKKYFFDCEAISDWETGSVIEFKMEKDGETIVAVKGIILNIEAEKLLQYSCFTPDTEQDKSTHTIVTYELASENGNTLLTVTQGDFGENEAGYQHTVKGWDVTLSGLKALQETPQRPDGDITGIEN